VRLQLPSVRPRELQPLALYLEVHPRKRNLRVQGSSGSGQCVLIHSNRY
jgi:hypothetical protein